MSHYDPGTPGQYSSPPPVRRPKAKVPLWAKLVAVFVGGPIVIVAAFMIVIGASLGAEEIGKQSADPAPVISTVTPIAAPTTDTPEAPEPPKPVEEAPPSYLPEDGTLLVGKDVKPGTYQTRVPDTDEDFGQSSCYWERLKGLGEDDVIDNALVNRVGALVTLKIAKNDYAVTISCNGATWKKVS